MLQTSVENISNLSVDDQIRFIERYLNRDGSNSVRKLVNIWGEIVNGHDVLVNASVTRMHAV